MRIPRTSLPILALLIAPGDCPGKRSIGSIEAIDCATEDPAEPNDEPVDATCTGFDPISRFGDLCNMDPVDVFGIEITQAHFDNTGDPIPPGMTVELMVDGPWPEDYDPETDVPPPPIDPDDEFADDHLVDVRVLDRDGTTVLASGNWATLNVAPFPVPGEYFIEISLAKKTYEVFPYRLLLDGGAQVWGGPNPCVDNP